MAERMREMLADREQLCIYDKPLQEANVIHLKVHAGVRLLTHFYGGFSVLKTLIIADCIWHNLFTVQPFQLSSSSRIGNRTFGAKDL